MKKSLIEILKPETEIERKIIKDPEFIEGALWGKSRHGHPEGQVYFHILEVFENINKFSDNEKQREKLRLIGLIHDTFKYKVNILLPRVGENHHAYFAYEFAKKYITDETILQIILFHDEIYHYWRKAYRTGEWNRAEYKLRNFVEKLYDFDLYSIFYQCDTLTGDKDNEPFKWFVNLIYN